MRKLIYILMVVIGLISCKTQKVRLGKFNVKGQSVIVKQYDFSSAYSIFVDTTLLHKKWTKKWSEYGVNNKREIHLDTALAMKIVREVLYPKRNQLKARKERLRKIRISLEVATGKPMGTVFGTDGPTIIKLEDFVKIDRLFKKYLRATFSGMFYQDYYYLDKNLMNVVPY